VGGGHEVLSAVVEDAQRNELSHVYCVRDRDFGPTNRPRWKAIDVTTFTLESFELECFLLDPTALASCSVNTANRTQEWIDEHLREQAGKLVWWMACRRTLAALREARQAMFPSHPKRTQVTSRAEAERVLLGNDWVTHTVPGLSKKAHAEQLCEDLLAAQSHYASLLEQGTWTTAFSGKELLAELVSWVYTKRRPRGNLAHQDIAIAVAEEQLASGREPPELLELRDAMLGRLPSLTAPS
jgi:hypothetical protein